MRMKRRIVFLSVLLIAALLSVGCGAQSGGDSASDSAETDECRQIVMTYMTLNTDRSEDLDQVLDAVNAISRAEIGVEVELLPVDAIQSSSEYQLWLSQGKQIDLMLIDYENINLYIQKHYLNDMQSYLADNAPGILELSETDDLLTAGTVTGHVYGVLIPSERMASGGGLWIAKRYLDEVGFYYDENKVYSMEELDSLFAKLKDRYPDRYPLGQVTGGNTYSTYSYFYGRTGDGVTPAVQDGVYVTSYETDQYREFLDWMRKWYKKYYILQDAAITEDGANAYFKQGITLTLPSASSPGIITDEVLGEETVVLKTSAVTVLRTDSPTNIFWTIPTTAQEPAAAAAFLNLMYTDERIVNLFAYGIEGQDYVKSEENDRVIIYPEGIDSDSVGYSSSLGVYGDQRLRYDFGSDELRKERERYDSNAEVLGEGYEGFVCDYSEVQTEQLAMQIVLEKYLPALESGSVDPDLVYPEFIEALHEAGSQTVIDEDVRQLKEWQEQHGLEVMDAESTEAGSDDN